MTVARREQLRRCVRPGGRLLVTSDEPMMIIDLCDHSKPVIPGTRPAFNGATLTACIYNGK
jgi:hypothetical protein